MHTIYKISFLVFEKEFIQKNKLKISFIDVRYHVQSPRASK